MGKKKVDDDEILGSMLGLSSVLMAVMASNFDREQCRRDLESIHKSTQATLKKAKSESERAQIEYAIGVISAQRAIFEAQSMNQPTKH